MFIVESLRLFAIPRKNILLSMAGLGGSSYRGLEDSLTGTRVEVACFGTCSLRVASIEVR